MTKTEFDSFLADRLREDQGVLVPVKASVFELMFMKKADPKRLHPNPEDEFCDPAIGPNYQIISDYAEQIKRSRQFDDDPWKEPLIVQKVRPEGYMLLNGHHRWAASLRMGYRPVKISVANLTQEQDIERMVSRSRHDKRVTLDLDEVAFCTEEGIPTEKPLSFPLSRMYKESIRRGIPALLRYLGRQGYDVWVYTAKYYSIEYLRAYFRQFSVKLDGIVTGTGRKTGDEEAIKRAKELVAARYVETLHIDRKLILRTHRGSKEFEEYPLDVPDADWSRAVIEIVGRLDRGESMG